MQQRNLNLNEMKEVEGGRVNTHQPPKDGGEYPTVDSGADPSPKDENGGSQDYNFGYGNGFDDASKD